MHNKKNLKKEISNLLKNQKLAVLATHGKVHPYNTLVGYAFTEDLKYLIFATMRSTRKYSNIIKNPNVSLLVDNRNNKPSDFKNALALTILAKTIKISKTKIREHSKIYLKRFPQLRAFISDPNVSIVLLKAQKYIFVQRFQEVFELEIK